MGPEELSFCLQWLGSGAFTGPVSSLGNMTLFALRGIHMGVSGPGVQGPEGPAKETVHA